MPATRQFKLVDPKQILIQDRQRQQLDTESSHPEKAERSLESLARSISLYGILNPILVDSSLNLIAGHRRLTAALQLGLPEVPIQFADLTSPEESQVIELEENLRRLDITWVEKVKAVHKYHLSQTKINPAWSRSMTADALDMGASSISRALLVAEALEANPKIATCSGIAAAYNQVVNLHDRAFHAGMAAEYDDDENQEGNEEEAEPFSLQPSAEHIQSIVSPLPPVSPRTTRSRSKGGIIEADFLEWAPEYAGPKFTLVHCDFPYGIDIDKSRKLRNQSHFLGTYGDSEDIYFTLIDSFLAHRANFLAASAHVLFWFSMNYYTPTVEIFSKAGFVVQPYPLFWHKTCGKGITPDTERGPKRIYETALLMSWQDRRIIRPVPNVYAGPTANAIHMSTKTLPCLRHFFTMLVDEHTSVLDPTCGSGGAIIVAEELRCERALGLEINPGFAQIANQELKLVRQKAKANMLLSA